MLVFKRITFLLLFLFLTGCGPDPTQSLNVATGSAQFNNSTVEVTLVGVLADDLAYNNKRGIYRIVDKKTGTEFIGISGVGITEIGSHKSGKNRIEDER